MKYRGIALMIGGIIAMITVVLIFRSDRINSKLDTHPEVAVTATVLLLACAFVIWVGATIVRGSKEP